MKKRWILLSLLCIAYPLSAQTAVYKCTIEDSVVYQDKPCAAGQTSTTLVDVPARSADPNNAVPAVLKQEPQPRFTSQPNNLVLGMTDTEVLNQRGWGRPGKITRSKGNRVWLEEWTYLSPAAGQRQLQFANGKLTAIHIDPVQVAQIAP